MTQDELEVEQYQALRAEILRGMEDGNQVMSFGIAAVGFVISAAFTLKDNVLGFLMLALLVPSISSLVLSLWFGAQERVARASYFVTGIEARLKIAINAKAMPTWDIWLRSSSKKQNTHGHHFWNVEYSGIGLFLFLMVGPMLLSWMTGGPSLSPCFKISTISIGAVAVVLFLLWMIKRVHRWRNWLLSLFGDLE